jgi:parallel beta-helix repeat protein
MKGLLSKIFVMGIVALFLGAVVSAFFKVNVFAYATGTIYIRANGLVEGTDKIVNENNVTYTFTDDINDSIVVERSNIIIDGDEYTLNGSWSLMVGFNLTSVSNVTIKNVNIVTFGYAMWLEGASQCVISNNTCTDNEGGIWLVSSTGNTVSGNNVKRSVEAVALDSSSGNNITGNNMTESHYSVYVIDNSTGNTISENNITTSSTSGIYLNGSPNNVISGNNIKDSPNEHICLLYSSNNNIISGNTLTNSTADVGIYVYACSLNSFFGNNITSNADTGIRLDSSSDSTISENNISQNLNGVYLWYSSNITISKNDITTNNQIGIVIDLSNNNTINGNNIMTNKGYGVDFNSASNKFFHNNFINNTVQVRAPNYNNAWDDGYPSGGNYWSDYNGTDEFSGPYQNETGSDLIGDTEYKINDDNIDHYPLMIPYETTPPTITILSPENKTCAVNASIPLTFKVDEFTSWMGYSLDGQANVTITENTTLPTLPDGGHHMTVYANDTFGNMGSATVYFTVDTTQPDITNVAQDPPTNILPDTVVKINATVTDATSGIKQVTLNYTTEDGTWITVEMTNLEGEIWNATIPAFPYGTNVTYMIIAEDIAGNTITTEQIYGYKYEYPVVPEFPSTTILLAFTMTTLLLAIVLRKKRTLLTRNKI